MSPVYAGAACRAITPNLDDHPVFLAGFQPNRPAAGIHDDLYARALAVRVTSSPPDPAQPDHVVLVVCDLIGLSHADVLKARRLAQAQGVDPRGLIVACTHTHSGPDTLGLWGASRWQSGLNPRDMDHVLAQIATVAAHAVADLRPACLRAGQVDLPRWLKNARRPRLVDRELCILQAVTSSGETIFTLINLACHPEVMFGENTLITADYAGAACRAIENRCGGTAILAVADLGGMMTPDVDASGRSFDTVEQMGQDVAHTALAALANGRNVTPSALHYSRREVRIPLQNPLFHLARATGALPVTPLDERGQLRTQVSLLDLGHIRLITIPGELLPAPGMALRRMLGVPYRFLIGLADDELGYLLASDDFVYPANPFSPGTHYEETMSVSRYALPLLMEAWEYLIGAANG